MLGDRRPARQDTFDLRDQIHPDDHLHPGHSDSGHYISTDDEEHSVLEDDSDGEERDVDYMDEDDDGSSTLSIPNESIDFDLVYSLHSFAATVEGQANVVKGDSLFLMDDSNSYWWLVRVLKTHEVGYIPAENIETPFERLARLNKHRNVDLASATQAELQEDAQAARNRLRNHDPFSRPGETNPNQRPGSRGVAFTPALSVHRYPPAVWNEDEIEEEDVEWDDEGYIDEDPDLAEDQEQRRRADALAARGMVLMEPDDGMGWDDSVAEKMQQARQAWGQSPPNQRVQIPSGMLPGSQPVQQQQQPQQPQPQQQQMSMAQQQEEQLQSQQQQQGLRGVTSRDRTQPPQDLSPVASPTKRFDPAEATETRKLTTTPKLLHEDLQPTTGSDAGSHKGSTASHTQDDERKRTRDEVDALEDAASKKVKAGSDRAGSVSSTVSARSSVVTPAKLRKEVEEERERQREAEREREREKERDKDKDKKEKKRSGVFGGLFGRKKDKAKDKGSSSEAEGRASDDSNKPGSRPSVTGPEAAVSPTTATAMQQQQHMQLQQHIQSQQQQQSSSSSSAEIQRATPLQQSQQSQASTPVSIPQVSQHASQLRQRDQQQQALYQQYLNRSPSSPPEAQPSYGLQSASAVMASGSYASSASTSGLGPPTSRPRPGSLIISSSTVDGHVPELSVIRVFAGKNVQTEATFKTVLLNTSTTSSDLVKQAIQRFRLPPGENADNYYLTVKQVEGSSAELLPEENPLCVFDRLVEVAMELPKVKRSSVGSISSLASNLSMHPAIRKLSMNDFTDDSAVKFYLNRRGGDEDNDSGEAEAADPLAADAPHGDRLTEGQSKAAFLSVATRSNNVTPERFSSPSLRFALQLVIYAEDLPDDMVFDPLTEAIMFKRDLRDRSPRGSANSGVSLSMRRKIFMFPKNITVAEVIEHGLERFGILEGVVDGGDEVEDKLTKRRSSMRVRYGLAADVAGHERELAPSSRVIDAFPRPPAYKSPDRRLGEPKRRSFDSTQLLGTSDDLQPDDPTFILRRAVSYRHISRNRLSAPLDEIALQHMQRESAASHSSMGSDLSAALANADEQKHRQQSRQDIIAAQRAATRANQRAILSTQSNSLRGVDVLLPGNAVLRSSRYDADDRMRYSYVEPDGETYDISDIVEEEWRETDVKNGNDLLEGALVHNKDGIGDRLDRVLNKVKDKGGRQPLSASSRYSHGSMRSAGSQYSEDDASRGVTPTSASFKDRFDDRTPTPTSGMMGLRVASPVSMFQRTPPRAAEVKPQQQTPSAPDRRVGSTTPETSGYVIVNAGALADEDPEMAFTPSPPPAPTPTPASAAKKRPYIPKDDFGVSHMLAIIEYNAKTTGGNAPLPPLDPVDGLLFGRPIDRAALHPQVREIYAGSFKQLEDMDKTLDEYLLQSINRF